MSSEEPLFDPSLKKRKKKQVAFHEDPLGAEADPTTPAPATIDDHTTNGDAVDMGPKTAHEQAHQNGHSNGHIEDDKVDGDDELKAMFDDLKKKKKKKEIPLDLGEEGSGTSTPIERPAATEDLDFSDIKKKKKSSKKKAQFDLEAFEKELDETKIKDADDEEGEQGEHIADGDDVDLGDDVFARGAEVSNDAESGNEPWLKSDRDYTYQELLHRFYGQLHASNSALLNASGKRAVIAPPQLHREGNKKTIFANVSDICKRLHRHPEQLIQYLFAELGTTGSVDGAGRLVIRGKYNQVQIEGVVRRYILEYVTCKLCKSMDTLLTKEDRILFMTCESCGSRRSVNAIKSGFQAQVGKRSKNKTG